MCRVEHAAKNIHPKLERRVFKAELPQLTQSTIGKLCWCSTLFNKMVEETKFGTGSKTLKKVDQDHFHMIHPHFVGSDLNVL